MLRFGKRKVILDKMKTFLIYIIFLLTVFGTSTASGNLSVEGKTCVIFTSALSLRVIGSFSIDDGKGSENVSFKMNSPFFNLCRVYSKLLKMASVGEFPWS